MWRHRRRWSGRPRRSQWRILRLRHRLHHERLVRANGWASEMQQVEADAHIVVDVGGSTSYTGVYFLPFALGDLDGDGMDDLFVNGAIPSGAPSGYDHDGSLWLIPAAPGRGPTRPTRSSTCAFSRRHWGHHGNAGRRRLERRWMSELLVQQGAYTSDVTGTLYAARPHQLRVGLARCRWTGGRPGLCVDRRLQRL